MKGLILAALLPLVSWSQETKPFVQTDFSGGLNTYRSPLLLQDNESSSLQNVILDENGSISRREGYQKRNNIAIGDNDDDVNAVYQLEQSDGDKYCIAFSSITGYYSTDACQTFTAFVSTLTRNNDVNCDSHRDREYCVNDQYNFYFDGTNDIQFTSDPADLDYLRVHRNRCFVAGNDANPSRLYWSNLNDCNTWTTSTDFIDLDSNDGDIITGIGEPLFGMLPVYKKFSSWLLKGDAPSNWFVVNVSKSIGARYHRSIRNFGNAQLFDSVGPNGGQPGIYSNNGLLIQEVSRNLRGEIDQLSNFKADTGRKIIDAKADWDTGTFDSRAMSSSRDPGTMQSSYTSRTDTVGTDWAGGTLTDLSTAVVTGSLVLVQNSSGTFINAGAESNSDSLNWNLGDWTPTAGTDFYGSYYWGDMGPNTCGGIFQMRVLNESNGVIINSDINMLDCLGVTEYIINTSTLQYNRVKVYFKWSSQGFPGSVLNERRSISFIRPSSIKVKVKDGCGTDCCPYFDIDESSQTLIGTYVSPIFETGISTPIWGPFDVSVTSGATLSAATGTLTIQVRVSTAGDGGGFDSYTTITNGAELTNAQKRFLQYQIRYEVDTATKAPPSTQSAAWSAASTGTWQSAETFLSNTISAGGWGLFQAEDTTSGSEASITYSIRTATYSGGTTYSPLVALTDGSAITASTGAYIVLRATFTIGVATETSKTDSLVINWTEGTSARSATAAVFKNRYHYGAQSNAGTVNDRIYVLDHNGAWVKWTGVNPRHLNAVSQKLMMASSTTTSAGFVFQLYQTDSDNNEAINAFWESKDYAMGNIFNIKAIDRLMLAHSNDATTLTATLKADTGNSSKEFSIDLSTGAAFGLTLKPIEPGINAKTFRVRFENNAASKPWDVLGWGWMYRDLGLMRP